MPSLMATALMIGGCSGRTSVTDNLGADRGRTAHAVSAIGGSALYDSVFILQDRALETLGRLTTAPGRPAAAREGRPIAVPRDRGVDPSPCPRCLELVSAEPITWQRSVLGRYPMRESPGQVRAGASEWRKPQVEIRCQTPCCNAIKLCLDRRYPSRA
jgi:hypothetical protein